MSQSMVIEDESKGIQRGEQTNHNETGRVQIGLIPLMTYS